MSSVCALSMSTMEFFSIFSRSSAALSVAESWAELREEMNFVNAFSSVLALKIFCSKYSLVNYDLLVCVTDSITGTMFWTYPINIKLTTLPQKSLLIERIRRQRPCDR